MIKREVFQSFLHDDLFPPLRCVRHEAIGELFVRQGERGRSVGGASALVGGAGRVLDRGRGRPHVVAPGRWGLR